MKICYFHKIKQYKLIISQSNSIEAIVNVNDNIFLQIEKTEANWVYHDTSKLFQIHQIQLHFIIYGIEYAVSITEDEFYFVPYKNITISTIRSYKYKTNLNNPQKEIEYILNYISKFIDNEIFE